MTNTYVITEKTTVAAAVGAQGLLLRAIEAMHREHEVLDIDKLPLKFDITMQLIGSSRLDYPLVETTITWKRLTK